MDDFLPLEERKQLAAALNTLLASPTFASWRQGVSLDIRSWLTPKDGKTPAVIVSVAHLDDDERTLVLGVLLDEILAYTRSLPGTRHLRALVVFDEVYGLLPPHPSNPPTKRPTVNACQPSRHARVEREPCRRRLARPRDDGTWIATSIFRAIEALVAARAARDGQSHGGDGPSEPC